MEFMRVNLNGVLGSIRTFMDMRKKIYAKIPWDVSSAEHEQKRTLSVIRCHALKILTWHNSEGCPLQNLIALLIHHDPKF